MAVDYVRLRSSTEEIAYRLEAVSPRAFEISDVDGNGEDTPYLDRTFPPTADAEDAVIVAAFDGITDFGQIRGDVAAGGWSYEITIPEYLCDFEDFWGGYLYATTRHGGALGVIGASGTDPDEVMLAKCFMRGVTSSRRYAEDTVRFRMESSASFLRDASFSRGIDWAAGLDHAGPVTLGAVIDHLLLQHTNFSPRSGYSVYLPDSTLDRLSLNGGSVMEMLRGVARNVCLEPWVWSSREDDLIVSGHPNCVGTATYTNGTSSLADPAIELDDTLVLGWEFTETARGETAQVTVSATKSDGTEMTATAYRAGGVGSRVQVGPIRCDDATLLQDITDRYLAHLNRRWRGTAELPLNLVCELGGIITVTTELTQRDVSMVAKPFVVTAITYDTNVQTGEFSSTLTLDEVLV